MGQGVISSRFSYLPIRFLVRQYTYQREVLIDTGFDGGIAVPPSLLENLGPPNSHELGEHLLSNSL
jgi:predicted aspartyl protease